MIKFFRNIRKRLLRENRFNKYLLYAIGEIVLVVIGILIALQINNNNEQKKKDLEANKLLIQIQDELLTSIGTFKSQKINYIKKDSIYRIIVSDTLTLEDMMNPKNYEIHRFTYDYHPYIVQKDGYNSFINKIDQFSEKYTSLEPQLKKLYSDFSFFYEASQDKLQEIVDRQYAYARDQKWYGNVWNRSNLTQEFANYLLNDYRYKNEARTYDHYVFSIVGVTTRFEKQAVDLYLKLHTITQQPKELPDLIKNYYSEYSKEYIDELLGTYDFVVTSRSEPITIEYKNNQLYLRNKKAFLKSGNEIIVDDFPMALIWKYDKKNKTISYALLQEGEKREKVK